MRLLLDTNVLIWWHLSKGRIGKRSTASIQMASLVCVSVISGWEMAIKKRVGKLELNDRFVDIVDTYHFDKLPLTYDHIEDYEKLPSVHKDPFDRMLIAQAITEDLILLSSDKIMADYPVNFLNAYE